MASATVTPSRSSFFSRPMRESGPASWITTTDHKKIAILYFWTVLVFFALGLSLIHI